MNTSKTKRIIGRLLASCIVGTALAGCSGGTAVNQGATQGTGAGDSTVKNANGNDTVEVKKDPVTLAWWYRGNGEQADTRKVQEAVNEMLKSYEGLEHVSIDLNCYPASDYATQVTLAQTAGKQIDILNTVSISFAEQVKNGTYIPLDNYITNMPELTAELPEWLLDLGKVNGETYMIPHYQQAASMMYFYTPKAYLDQYGDDKKIREVLLSSTASVSEKAAVLEEYTLAVRAGEGNTKYAPPFAQSFFMNSRLGPWYDELYYGSTAPVRVLEGMTTAVFYPFTEEMKEAYGIGARWYAEGLVHPDPTIDYKTLEKANMMNDTALIYAFNNGIGSNEHAAAKMTDEYGFEVVAFATHDQYFIKNTWGAGGDGVTASSKHPEEAIKFIEAMNIERGKEIYNTIVYGIEGVHYEKIDDNNIRTFGYDGAQGGSDYLYSAHKWIMGNTFNAYYNQGSSEEDTKIVLEINEGNATQKSMLMGLVLNTGLASTQFGQVSAVHAEYVDALNFGVMGDRWEAFYEEYKKKIETAGIEQVMEIIQGQIDEFLANKN